MTSSNHITEESCIFCGIVAGNIPAQKVYEDEHVLAFMNIKPVNEGHALVVPKDHFENIYSVPAELLCRMTIVTQKVALSIKNAVSADGINIIMNNESAAGQEIFHAHIHVIPRENEDGLTHWPARGLVEATSLETIAEKVKKELEV